MYVLCATTYHEHGNQTETVPVGYNPDAAALNAAAEVFIRQAAACLAQNLNSHLESFNLEKLDCPGLPIWRLWRRERLVAGYNIVYVRLLETTADVLSYFFPAQHHKRD